MDKVTLAERLIVPITGATRASEIVGDLLEETPSTGTFWFSVIRIVLAYTWRWLVGIPAAMLSAFIPAVPFVEALKRQVAVASANGSSLEHNALLQFSAYTLVASMVVWSVAALCLARFGLRSRLTQVTGLLALLLSVSSYALCVGSKRTGVVNLTAAVLLTLLAVYRDRSAAAMVFSTSITQAGLFFLWAYSLGFATDHFGAASSSLPFLAFFGWIAVYIGQACVFAKTARWIRPHLARKMVN